MVFNSAGHVLKHALSPAPVGRAIPEAAQQLACDVVTRLGGVGMFAVEMFLTPSNDLLVNEIAPRVHNSGHLTLEAHQTCQYEQHLRAILGLPLASCVQLRPAAMLNILSDDSAASMVGASSGVTTIDSSTTLHWYGKQANKARRKMGHITSVADDLHSALTRAEATLSDLTSQSPRAA